MQVIKQGLQLRIIEAIAFALDECDNRILEAHAEGKARTKRAWEGIRTEYERTLGEVRGLVTDEMIGRV